MTTEEARLRKLLKEVKEVCMYTDNVCREGFNIPKTDQTQLSTLVNKIESHLTKEV